MSRIDERRRPDRDPRGAAWARAGLLCAVLFAAGACRSQTIPSTKLEDPVPLDLSGTWVHPPSGIAFPAQSAGFQRVAPKQYDREGNDVGIGYRRFWLDPDLVFRAEVTLFVYPAWPAPFDVQFDDEIASVVRGKVGIREVRRRDTRARHAGAEVVVRAVEFEFRGDERMGRLPMVTVLAAFRREPWHVTYRVTVPPPRRDVCLAAVEELLSSIELPPIGLPYDAVPAVR